MSDSQKHSVLFVCLGNICRSPAAEGVMQSVVQQRGVQDRFLIDSAGTSSYHIGEPADRRMRDAAQSRGIQLTSRSRMVSPRDFSKFDLIVAMDKANYRELVRTAGGSDGKVRMLSDYLDESWAREVPDPYYGSDDGFGEVLDMLQAACPAIVDQLIGRSAD